MVLNGLIIVGPVVWILESRVFVVRKWLMGCKLIMGYSHHAAYVVPFCTDAWRVLGYCCPFVPDAYRVARTGRESKEIGQDLSAPFFPQDRTHSTLTCTRHPGRGVVVPWVRYNRDETETHAFIGNPKRSCIIPRLICNDSTVGSPETLFLSHSLSQDFESGWRKLGVTLGLDANSGPMAPGQ